MIATPPPTLNVSLPAIVQQVASTIAHEQVVVSCIGNLGDDGEDAYQYISLNVPVCVSLRRFLLRGDRSGAAMNAVLTLTHEAEHASGLRNETTTECAAMRDVGRVIRLLGFRVTLDMRRTLRMADQMTPDWSVYHAHPCR